MSIRKITKQQANRIKAMQERRRQRANESTETQIDLDLEPEQHGLILTHHGKYVDVESESREIVRCHIRQHLGSFIAGDRVVWQRHKLQQTGVVTALLPRTSLIWRLDDRENIKPIAANIDQIFLVIAVLPEPTWQLVDRYLVAAHRWQIPINIILNKIDLLNEHHHESLLKDLTIYQQIGYQVLQLSSQQSETLKLLSGLLANKTSIFVGQSGVGKSSLINQLTPDANARVGILSLQKNHGAHTTSQSCFYHLADNGAILDTPGIRSLNLNYLTIDDIEQGFPDLHPYLGHCQFRNCRHLQEPGCAILHALENEKISKTRYESFIEMAKNTS